jgi:polyhydroxyalkanoate synthesis regulator phasin
MSSTAKYVNRTVNAKLKSFEKERKKLHAEAKRLVEKVGNYAKTQTKKQEKKCHDIMKAYYSDIDDADKAMELTKAQIMVHRLMQQVEVYEGK